MVAKAESETNRTASADDDRADASARSFDVHHQAVFIEDGTVEDGERAVDEKGLLKLDDTPFETTLFDHGVNVDTRSQTSRIETAGSDDFIDDRPLTKTGNSLDAGNGPGMQGTLFADTAVDQRTLEGDQASARFMFEAEQRRQEADNEA